MGGGMPGLDTISPGMEGMPGEGVEAPLPTLNPANIPAGTPQGPGAQVPAAQPSPLVQQYEYNSENTPLYEGASIETRVKVRSPRVLVTEIRDLIKKQEEEEKKKNEILTETIKEDEVLDPLLSDEFQANINRLID